MHVKFHSVKFKNLLSYGNAETEITLDKYRHTIVTATNGAGKSSAYLDSITYALYGKPYRNIKLGQLINSINGKGLLVTVNFSIGSDHYIVKRGQKPSIFEIHKNGSLILEDSASRDYQEYLETVILGISYKTFKQIVVIGSATYIPFMSLSAAERRAITEDVLDISIFSDMSDIAKKRVLELKSAIESLTFEISNAQQSITAQKSILVSLEREQTEQNESNELIKQELLKQIAEYKHEIVELDTKIETYKIASERHSLLVSNRQKCQLQLAKLESRYESLMSTLAFYDSAACPTCNQAITQELKQLKQLEFTTEQNQIREQQNKVVEYLSAFDAKINEQLEYVNLYQSAVNSKYVILNRLNDATAQLNKLQKQTTKTTSIDLCKETIEKLINTVSDKTDLKLKTSTQFDYYKTAVELLKDSGIKAKVISTFIPILNKTINEYLEKFDLFINFELDETFNETIKSRGRDAFSYNSFSEGEKAKLNICILMAWRKIAISRNSVSTNLLVFDETMDTSMDDDSVSVFTDILESVEGDVNTVVISHRNVIPELFDQHVQIKKVRDFSVIESIQ